MAPEEGRVQWRNAQGDKDVHGPDAHFSAVTRYPTTFPSQLSVLVLTALLELSKRNTEETLPLPLPSVQPWCSLRTTDEMGAVRTGFFWKMTDAAGMVYIFINVMYLIVSSDKHAQEGPQRVRIY